MSSSASSLLSLSLFLRLPLFLLALSVVELVVVVVVVLFFLVVPLSVPVSCQFSGITYLGTGSTSNKPNSFCPPNSYMSGAAMSMNSDNRPNTITPICTQWGAPQTVTSATTIGCTSCSDYVGSFNCPAIYVNGPSGMVSMSPPIVQIDVYSDQYIEYIDFYCDNGGYANSGYYGNYIGNVAGTSHTFSCSGSYAGGIGLQSGTWIDNIGMYCFTPGWFSCASNTCSNGGTCTYGNCICPNSGIVGQYCQWTSATHCQGGGQVVASAGSYYCNCNTGYTPGPNSQSCLANCAVSTPANGGLGSCPSSLPAGSSCSIACNTGYSASLTTTQCSSSSQLTPQTCIPIPFSSSVTPSSSLTPLSSSVTPSSSQTPYSSSAPAPSSYVCYPLSSLSSSFSGSLILLNTSSVSSDGCAVYCRATAYCVGFVFDLTSGACTLKSEIQVVPNVLMPNRWTCVVGVDVFECSNVSRVTGGFFASSEGTSYGSTATVR